MVELILGNTKIIKPGQAPLGLSNPIGACLKRKGVRIQGLPSLPLPMPELIVDIVTEDQDGIWVYCHTAAPGFAAFLPSFALSEEVGNHFPMELEGDNGPGGCSYQLFIPQGQYDPGESYVCHIDWSRTGYTPSVTDAGTIDTLMVYDSVGSVIPSFDSVEIAYEVPVAATGTFFFATEVPLSNEVAMIYIPGTGYFWGAWDGDPLPSNTEFEFELTINMVGYRPWSLTSTFSTTST